MDSISRQLKKGVLDILLLTLLTRGRMYGYELMSTLDAESGGYFAMKEGTLYPILYRLEDAGFIQSDWEQAEGRRGVPRKYYAITAAGESHLRAARRELGEFTRSIQAIMGRID